MYEFYLDGVRLPVTPGEITMSNGANIDVVDLANGQKITRWIGRDLETITFKASFPSTRYASFVDSELKQPLYYIDKFMGLMRRGTPFEFVMFDHKILNDRIDLDSISQSQSQFDTSKSLSTPSLVKTMYIQSLQRTESAENGSEVEMEFTLLEWVEKETKTYTVYGRNINLNVGLYEETNYDEGNWHSVLESEEIEPISIIEPPNRLGKPFPKSGSIITGKTTTPIRDRHGNFTCADNYVSLAFNFYSDVNKAKYIKSLNDFNPKLKPYSTTEFLPSGTIIRIRDISEYGIEYVGEFR